MNYLAIDTASKSLKILIKVGEKSSYYENAEYRSASESLMFEIDRMLKEMGADLKEMDYFACVIGPGSFTGIRIGMATIKAFAYVYKKPVIAVTALELIAYNESKADTVIAISDASNGKRYVAVYDDKMRVIMSPQCIEGEDLAAFLSEIEEPYLVLAESEIADEIKNAKTPENYEAALRAAVERGLAKAVSGNELEPLYIRKPQAEQDLEKKNAEASKLK